MPCTVCMYGEFQYTAVDNDENLVCALATLCFLFFLFSIPMHYCYLSLFFFLSLSLSVDGKQDHMNVARVLYTSSSPHAHGYTHTFSTLSY